MSPFWARPIGHSESGKAQKVPCAGKSQGQGAIKASHYVRLPGLVHVDGEGWALALGLTGGDEL